jgi:hypothetical protein
MQYSKKIYSILTYLYCLLFIIHYSCPGGGAAGRRRGGAAYYDDGDDICRIIPIRR